LQQGDRIAFSGRFQNRGQPLRFWQDTA